MVMESMDLTAAWKLPVLFACKDDGWSITTPSPSMTAGSLEERSRGLGVPAVTVDGLDAAAVAQAAGEAIERARSGAGPAFLRARCVRLDAHFLGFPLIRMVSEPLTQGAAIAGPLVRSLVAVGVGVHRALAAAKLLREQGISADVLDLRTVSPLDVTAICQTVGRTRRLLVVDEDYEGFGLSGEVAAVALEAGLQFSYARLCTWSTIPYARNLEDEALPNPSETPATAGRRPRRRVPWRPAPGGPRSP